MLTLLSSLRSASEWMAPDSRSSSRPSSAPLGAGGACLAGAFDVVAQQLEFALQAGAHLVAQFLAQRAQFAGDLADGGDAVFLAAHAVDVAGDRLIWPFKGGAAAILAARGVAAQRAPWRGELADMVRRLRRACARAAASSVLERAVELLRATHRAGAACLR